MSDLNSHKSEFYNKARKHQINYKENILGIKQNDGNDVVLVYEDAVKGLNFYPQKEEVLKIVQDRFDRYKATLYANMLRSEHIPFNFFAPLINRRNNEETLSFFNKIFPQTNINSISEIKIEYAPSGKEKYLDDLTSFDTYIEYRDTHGENCGIGIEVKYTELSYPYGATEKERMFDENEQSFYHITHNNSDIFKTDSIRCLRTKQLKQFWRNHLLGLKMVQNGDLKKFFSAHIFPSGNTYQKEMADKYISNIKPEFRYQFIPVTYESFFDALAESFQDNLELKNWIKYLLERYIPE